MSSNRFGIELKNFHKINQYERRKTSECENSFLRENCDKQILSSRTNYHLTHKCFQKNLKNQNKYAFTSRRPSKKPKNLANEIIESIAKIVNFYKGNKKRHNSEQLNSSRIIDE